MHSNDATVHCFDGLGVFDDDADRIPFRSVTSIQYGDRYTQTHYKYLKTRTNKQLHEVADRPFPDGKFTCRDIGESWRSHLLRAEITNGVSMQILKLPKRYEALERAARESDADLSRIIQRTDSAADRIEILLRQVRDGGLGRFELILVSRALKDDVLPHIAAIFGGVAVNSVPSSTPLADVADYIRNHNQLTGDPSVWVMYDRDNPTDGEAEIRRFCESMRFFFVKRSAES